MAEISEQGFVVSTFGEYPHPVSGYITKDSGEREAHPSGMVRDTRKGKGRFDLMSPIALRRLAGVYERGAEKYNDHNWRKGAPLSRFLDSAERHINSYKENQWKGVPQDEDHIIQAMWNLMALAHLEETNPELQDIK